VNVRWIGLTVLLLGVVTVAGYWLIIARQGAIDEVWIPYLVSGLILVPSAACAIGASGRLTGRPQVLVLAWSAVTLLALAFITGFSIGFALLPAGLLTCYVWAVAGQRNRTLWTISVGFAGALLGVATVVGFLSLEPFLPPSCPSRTGSLTGGSDYSAGLLTPPVHITYACRDGKLVTWTRTIG
jgi:hypothetical protein